MGAQTEYANENSTSNVAADAPPRRHGFQPTDLALIAIFAAFIGALAQIPPIFVVGAVPFAMQMIGVLLAPMVLGSLRAGAACTLYVVVGVLGMPIFAGQRGGPGVLLSASGGYLIAFIPASFIAGAVATAVLRRRPRKPLLIVWLYVVALVSLAVIYLGGIVGQMINVSLSLSASLAVNAPLFALDLVKAAFAVVLAIAILTAYPRLLPAVRHR